jgi:hypothetical protein
VTRIELRWLLLASLAVLLFASLPTLYAWRLADADHVFTGFVYNTEDGNSYIAKMRLGARGEWLFHLPYTSEEHEGALVYLFYLILGKLAAGLGLSHVLAYHLARVLLGLFLLLTVYLFVATFTPDVAVRRLAWALVAVGSGLGWLLTVLGASHWLGDLPLDFWVPEAYVFLVLYNLPHLALAESALLWAILWTLRAFETGRARWCLPAGLSALVMATILPFYAGVVAAALGAFVLALLFKRRQIPWHEIGLTALTGLGALPPVAYNAWVFTINPAFRVWAAQNRILSPPPLQYLLGFALLLVPAAWGMRQALCARDERWLLPLAWVLVVPILLYVPFTLQRRMIAAVQVPLALLAATGLWVWFEGRPALRRWGPAGYVALASLSYLVLVLGSLGFIGQRGMPIFRPGTEGEALAWLNAHATPGEAVLASFEVGNVIPAQTDQRVFAGHGPETLHSDEKLTLIDTFFQPETRDAWRQTLLQDYDLDYLFYGPEERALGAWNPANAPYLVPVYDQHGYQIYQVAGAEQP